MSLIKEIGLFALILFSLVAVIVIQNRSMPSLRGYIAIIIFFGGLIAYYYGVKVCSKESFHFEVTPAKLCDGGPYMYSSAPEEVKNHCNKLLSSQEGVDQYNMYNCNGAYVGRPLNFPKFTAPSNDLWENDVCKQQSFNGPAVL